MLSKQEEVIRVGVWVVVMAAIVGLVVLLLTGVAYPQEPSQPEDMARLLVPGTGPSAGERLEEAQSLLREDRRRRLSGLHLALIDTAWQAFTQASPKRLLQSARRVFRQVRGWRGRSPAEDRALDLLEAEVRAGSEDSQLRELYQELRGREDRERLKRLLREAERAIAAGDLRLARRRLERVRALDPHAPRVAAASQALEERETALKTVPESQASPEIEGLEAWEAPLGAALLLERYGFALELPSARPDAALAQAVAAYLSGATDEALLYYGRFVELWQDADAELQPRVEAARRASAALSSDR